MFNPRLAETERNQKRLEKNCSISMASNGSKTLVNANEEIGVQEIKETGKKGWLRRGKEVGVWLIRALWSGPP